MNTEYGSVSEVLETSGQDICVDLRQIKLKKWDIYGSVSAGREKRPFNVLFFLKVEPPCDQT